MLVKLKDSLLPAIKDIQGEMKDILRQDVAECNAKMLGEVKDAIKDIQGELKDSLRQDFADNNTKMLGKLKDSLLPVGVMKDILRQDIADCNTNMLGELKDSLLPAIKNIYDEAKEEMKHESDLSRNQILGDLKESVRPVIKTIKEELKGEILESTVKVMGDMREYLHQLIKSVKDEIGKDLIDALRNIPNKASIVASRDSTSPAPVQNDNRQQHLMKDVANPLQAASTDSTIFESEPILPISVSAPVAVIKPLKQGIMEAQCSSSCIDMATKATNHQDRESAGTVTPQSQEEGE